MCVCVCVCVCVYVCARVCVCVRVGVHARLSRVASVGGTVHSWLAISDFAESQTKNLRCSACNRTVLNSSL